MLRVEVLFPNLNVTISASPQPYSSHSHTISACAGNHKNITEVVEQKAWKASPDQKEEIGGSGVQKQWHCGRKERRTLSEG